MVVLSEFVEGSSSSSPTHQHTHIYDVFISFRGVDTRNSFTAYLYEALLNADLTIFLDDEEIETGQDLKPELENAIKSSRASIIVLSKNYASSTWCLDELVLILEQLKKNSDYIVIPIFYHVEPTDVRKQRSSFGDAMENHKQRMGEETNEEKKSKWAQKIELWKEALTQVANLKGKDVKDRKETDFIKEIVTDIYRRLGVPLRSPLPLLIGMDYSINFITSWLKDGSLHTVDIITILGIGGIGKTSLAKYIYRLHRHEFLISSLVEDISRRCDADKVNGLLNLQNQLCGDISKTSSIQVHNVSLYTSRIENALACKKALLVLDDIDSLEQLDALLGKKGFHPGSKIIITTKDASLTERCALFKTSIQPIHKNHLLEGLSWYASLELLCHHAFTCTDPKEGYEEVSEKLVLYCEGHPLALEVLGKSLHNRDVVFWEECVGGLKNEPHSRIQKALQMSFDSLPSKNDKELFKHIACFFVGMDRHYIETILNACVKNTRSGIMNLNERCLLMIEDDNTLMMHQLLQDMGRDIVRQESPNKPWKRSRLCCHEESFEVLKRKKGTGNLLGLALDMRMLEKEKLHGSMKLETDALSKMNNLMLLQLNYVHLNGSYENFPEKLRWLCMHGFPLKSIPVDLPMENLVVLTMSYSNIESFDMSFYSKPKQPRKKQKLSGSHSKEKQSLGSLKILDLSFCEQLRSLGGFLELPALERLILRKCISLIEVCESVEQCVELVHVDLSYCNKLQNLLTTLGKLKKVKTLSLEGCDLDEFPIIMKDVDSWKTPRAKNSVINSQSSSSAIVKAIPNDLKLFPTSLSVSLVSLSLANNKLSNESFPVDLSCMSMLKCLSLDENPIVSLPNFVRSLPRLEKLSVSNCTMLTSIEHPPRTLRVLSVLLDTFPHCDMHLLRKFVFDQDMSPLKLDVDLPYLPSSYEFEGMVKIQPLADVEEKVLRSLGWSNLEFLKERSIVTLHPERNTDAQIETEVVSKTQMYYEFGIFSTIYEGEEMPNWISERRKGSSISFTIPSSPNKFRGLNFCYRLHVPSHQSIPMIVISNVTKNRTWIYYHNIEEVCVDDNCLIMLSHWMFGMNDMEAGDHVTVTLSENFSPLTLECGVGFVYDDEEEEVLGYYKSWNHILGGDLDGFLLTTGEYYLNNCDFLVRRAIFTIRPFLEEVRYKDQELDFFRAFSQRKPALLGHLT